jgi:hypothetical protein
VTLPLVPLEEGNHFQMGDYGYQYFDEIAVVSQDQQQAVAAQLVVTYLDSLAPKLYQGMRSCFVNHSISAST